LKQKRDSAPHVLVLLGSEQIVGAAVKVACGEALDEHICLEAEDTVYAVKNLLAIKPHNVLAVALACTKWSPLSRSFCFLIRRMSYAVFHYFKLVLDLNPQWWASLLFADYQMT
jgi:hypothetical protein